MLDARAMSPRPNFGDPAADAAPASDPGPRTDDDALAVLRAAVDAQRGPPLAGVLVPRGLGPYRGYGEVLAALLALAERGARVARVGRSVRGEPIFALVLGARPGAHNVRPTALVSALHPNEWIGVEAHLALLERLVARDLGARSIVAFPVANPDGLCAVERNLRRGRHRFVRHNARGVDLNRNFDASSWRRGVLRRLLPFVFAPGRAPASEPEVASIARALAGRRVDRALSLHAFGGAVLYPSAASIIPVADLGEHREWARRIARDADPRAYRATSCALWSLGFTAGGLELDWFHERHGALSLLVECSRGGFGLSPSRLIEPFAWFNPPRPAEIAARLADALLPFAAGEG
jgi:hypothetical protein